MRYYDLTRKEINKIMRSHDFLKIKRTNLLYKLFSNQSKYFYVWSDYDNDICEFGDEEKIINKILLWQEEFLIEKYVEYEKY